MPDDHDTSQPRRPKVLEQKWSTEVIEAGWVGSPSVMMEFAPYLGLDPVDFMIIAIIADHWWAPDDKAYPSKALLASRLGVTPRTVQRRVEAMERRGLIRRVKRRTASGSSGSNAYDLAGLREALRRWAPHSRRHKREA